MKELSANLVAKGLRIAVVVSRFNDFLTKQLLEGCVDGFVRHGGTEDDITVAWVPGANECSQVVDKLAAQGAYHAVVALGAAAAIAVLLQQAEANQLPGELRLDDWRQLDDARIAAILDWAWGEQKGRSPPNWSRARSARFPA